MGQKKEYGEGGEGRPVVNRAVGVGVGEKKMEPPCKKRIGGARTRKSEKKGLLSKRRGDSEKNIPSRSRQNGYPKKGYLRVVDGNDGPYACGLV